MAHYNPQQPNYQRDIYDDEKLKDPIIALILTILLGPLGLCYVTVPGGFLLMLIMLSKKFVLLKSSCWAVSIIWAVIATNRPLKTKFAQFIGRVSYQEQDLPLYPLEQDDIPFEGEQSLNRKAPHTRHFFAYIRNEVSYKGLKPNYSPFFNTVIRPDIDVENDIHGINEGHGMIPTDHIETVKKLRNREFVYYSIALCLTLPFLMVDKMAFLLIFVTSILALLIIRPFKSYVAIEALEFQANQTEWLIHGRVYGEQLNEIGDTVLYPKRGEGFYPLTGLEYLKLYTLQFHKGNTEKSETLFHNLVKGHLQNRNPASHYIKEEMKDKANEETYRKIGFYAIKLLAVFAPNWVKKNNIYNLVEDPQRKIEAIYDECCRNMPFDSFI